jgi:hypothetical protein
MIKIIKEFIWEIQNKIQEKHENLATLMGEIVIIIFVIILIASLFDW